MWREGRDVCEGQSRVLRSWSVRSLSGSCVLLKGCVFGILLTILRKSYLNWLERFAKFSKTNDLESLPESVLSDYLDHMAVVEKVSAGTQRQALNALVFLYREVFKRELGDFGDYRRGGSKKNIPTVLTLTEIERLLAELPEQDALMACLHYGAGLRVSELARLRIKDVDFERGQVVVRGGKGNKDRVTLLPESLVPSLKRHRDAVRKVYEVDRQVGVAGVYLPEALARKYKHAGERWEWFWFWPAAGLAEDPRARGTIRRHHVLAKSYQGRKWSEMGSCHYLDSAEKLLT